MVKKNKIVGITGIDTRNCNFIRDKGAPSNSFNKKGKLNIKNFQINNKMEWP